MAYERQSDSKVRGDSLDSFVANIAKSFANQVSLRNAEDETNFNTAVLENNLSLPDQLTYRQDQLKRVSDDPTERKRIRGEIASLKDRIEQKTFSDAYLAKLVDFESGISSIDSVISFLNDSKAGSTDQAVLDAINKELVTQNAKKFDITKNLLTNQTEYAVKDKSLDVIDAQIAKVTSAKNKALLAGDDSTSSMYDLQLQTLTKAKTETSIAKDVKNFAVSSITGFASATALLDAYNSKISSAATDGPITIGDITYSSAKEFWTYKRDTYIADQSPSGLFSRMNDEVTSAIKTADSKSNLDTGVLNNATTKYNSLTGRPELAGYEAKIESEKQNALQVGAKLISDSILNKFSRDYDLNAASNALNSLKTTGVNVDDAFTKLITAGSQIKQGQVSNIITAAQNAMQNDPKLSIGQAIQMAISSGASQVLSPTQLTTKDEKAIATDITAAGQAGQGTVDPRLTTGAPTTTPAATPTPATAPAAPAPAPTGGSIVDYLKSKNLDSSFTARAKLASDNGIVNYTGTAEQNTQLLTNIQKNAQPASAPTPTPAAPVAQPTQQSAQPKPAAAAPAPAPAPAPAAPAPKPPSTTYQGSSIVDYLGSLGQDNSFTARAKIAASKGIAGYQGTADQNTQLLKTLRGF